MYREEYSGFIVMSETGIMKQSKTKRKYVWSHQLYLEHKTRLNCLWYKNMIDIFFKRESKPGLSKKVRLYEDQDQT